MRGIAVVAWGILVLASGMAVGQDGGLLVPQWRGDSVATVLSFSPDGERLAAGTTRGELLFFDTKTLLETGRAGGLLEMPVMVAWSGDGGSLYSVFSGKEKSLWIQHNVATGASQQVVELNLAIRSAALEPGGKRMLAVETGTRQETVWYLTTAMTRGETVRVPDGFETNVVAISEDGERFALGAKDGRVALYNKQSVQQSLFQCSPDGEVVKLALSPSGNRIACGNSGKRVYVYGLGAQPTLEVTVVTDGNVTSVALPYRGPGVYVGAEGTGGYYDEQGNVERSFTDPENEYQPAALTLATDRFGRVALGMANSDIVLMETRETKSYQPLGTTTFLALKGSISADGSTAFFLAPLGGSVGALDLATGALLERWPRTEEDYYPEAFTLSPNGSLVATKDRNLEVRVYEVNKGKEVGQPYGGSEVLAVSHSGESLLWASNDDGRVGLADVKGERDSVPLAGQTARHGVFSLDDSAVYVGFEDGSVVGFDAKTGSELVRWKAEGAVGYMALGTKGSLLLARGTDRVVMADAKSGSERELFQVPGAVGHVAMSGDGNWVVASNVSGRVVLWDLAAGTEAWSYDVVGAVVEDVGFSATGSKALVACDDGTVRYVSVRTGTVAAVAKYFEEGAWFIGTSAGYYDGSPGIERHFAIRDEGVLKPLKAAATRYRDGKKVKAVLK